MSPLDLCSPQPVSVGAAEMAQTPTYLELQLQERANDPFWLVWASVYIRIKKQKQKTRGRGVEAA